MPRTAKASLPGRKEKHSGKKGPESADDWLNEAISLEDSGDRWTQDPAKAERFYRQSLAAYETPLSLDARSFDAAFNRARLFLQISNACALLALPRLEVIKLAIFSHRELATGYSDHTDVRYNLAMVLMHYAEVVCEHKVLEACQTDGSVESALQEAMEALEWCRVKQSTELEGLTLDTVDEGDQDGSVQDSAVPEEQELEVDVSYITYDILLDTLVSIVECYNQMLELEALTNSTHIDIAQKLVTDTIWPQIEIVLPKCRAEDSKGRIQVLQHVSQITHLEYQCRATKIDLAEWKSQLERLITEGQLKEPSVEVLCANSDACVSLAAALSSTQGDQSETWKILTTGALPQITAAITQMQNNSKKCPTFFLTKGDIELLRSSISTDVARRNRPTLLKNAIVYYNRAANDCLPKDVRSKNEAVLKAAIVQGEISTDAEPPKVPAMTRDEAGQIVSDARADGLFQGSWKLLDTL